MARIIKSGKGKKVAPDNDKLPLETMDVGDYFVIERDTEANLRQLLTNYNRITLKVFTVRKLKGGDIWVSRIE